MMNIFQVQVCFDSTLKCISALKRKRERKIERKKDGRREEGKKLKRDCTTEKKTSRLLRKKTSILWWFKWLLLWLFLCFNTTLEIFTFQFNVYCTYFASEVLCWKIYCFYVPRSHSSLFPLLVSAKPHPFFLSVATVSMSKWDLQRWCMSLNCFWSSLIAHFAQEKFRNNTSPDSKQPFPTHLDI